jgi:hypothetical protein
MNVFGMIAPDTPAVMPSMTLAASAKAQAPFADLLAAMMSDDAPDALQTDPAKAEIQATGAINAGFEISFAAALSVNVNPVAPQGSDVSFSAQLDVAVPRETEAKPEEGTLILPTDNAAPVPVIPALQMQGQPAPPAETIETPVVAGEGTAATRAVELSQLAPTKPAGEMQTLADLSGSQAAKEPANPKPAVPVEPQAAQVAGKQVLESVKAMMQAQVQAQVPPAQAPPAPTLLAVQTINAGPPPIAPLRPLRP